MTLSEELSGSFAVLDEVVATHAPSLKFVLFSGGHDSLATVTIAQDWARERGHWLPVAHVNTGTGLKETHDFVVKYRPGARLCEGCHAEQEVES